MRRSWVISDIFNQQTDYLYWQYLTKGMLTTGGFYWNLFKNFQLLKLSWALGLLIWLDQQSNFGGRGTIVL